MKENKAEKNFYPTWMYHKKKGEKLILSQDEFDSLNGEWVDSPSKFEKSSCKIGEDANECKFLSLEDLKVEELKEMLVNEYKVELTELKKVKKDDLIEMLKKFKGE